MEENALDIEPPRVRVSFERGLFKGVALVTTGKLAPEPTNNLKIELERPFLPGSVASSCGASVELVQTDATPLFLDVKLKASSWALISSGDV